MSEQPDYIHASFVPVSLYHSSLKHSLILSFTQSYLSNRAYIVTQGPLPDTRRDFFKMIFDRDVVAVVMLTGNEDSNNLEHVEEVLCNMQLLY